MLRFIFRIGLQHVDMHKKIPFPMTQNDLNVRSFLFCKMKKLSVLFII